MVEYAQWKKNCTHYSVIIFNHNLSILLEFYTHAFSCYALGGYSIASAESREPIHKQGQPIRKIYTDYLRRQP